VAFPFGPFDLPSQQPRRRTLPRPRHPALPPVNAIMIPTSRPKIKSKSHSFSDSKFAPLHSRFWRTWSTCARSQASPAQDRDRRHTGIAPWDPAQGVAWSRQWLRQWQPVDPTNARYGAKSADLH